MERKFWLFQVKTVFTERGEHEEKKKFDKERLHEMRINGYWDSLSEIFN